MKIRVSLTGTCLPRSLKARLTSNPTAFPTLVGKVLSLQMTGANDGPVMIVTGVPRATD
jgi:hypothetical protein